METGFLKPVNSSSPTNCSLAVLWKEKGAEGRCGRVPGLGMSAGMLEMSKGRMERLQMRGGDLAAHDGPGNCFRVVCLKVWARLEVEPGGGLLDALGLHPF